MRNKKAWLRIVEASIAVLIVASVLMIMISRTPGKDRSEEVHEMQRFILEQISLNETLRGEILQEDQTDKTETESFVRKNLPVYYDFAIKVCEIEEICGMPFYIEKEIYADEILITANLTYYQPKKLKFFVWVE
jgi:hypothetical protein